jgi:glyoxylase-like metal-dependent hydrolase (beta-lactamase superfamily II)
VNQSLLNQISEHVYWLAPDGTVDRPTLGVIVGEESTLVVDAGNSPAHAQVLLAELEKLGIAYPKHVVLTHWHWDHVFGASAFNATVYASEETCRLVATMAEWDWSDEALDQRVRDGTEIEFCRDMIKLELPDRSDLKIKVPDVSFETELEFDLGGVTCKVKHVGGDHASDSSIVSIIEDGIVFLGDCSYEDLHHGPRNYTQRIFALTDELLSLNARHYIWGHHPEPMPRSEMVKFADLVKLIGNHIEQTGDDREPILNQLSEKMGRALDEDSVEIVDAFLAGLKR